MKGLSLPPSQEKYSKTMDLGWKGNLSLMRNMLAITVGEDRFQKELRVIDTLLNVMTKFCCECERCGYQKVGMLFLHQDNQQD